jgi:BNR/Asp-box repeat
VLVLTRFRLALAAAGLVALVASLTAGANVALTTISTDPYKNVTSQHATEVEPDSFAFGSTIVVATQVGRFGTGGSSNIGWGRSTNGGTSWTHGFLPGLTVYSTPAGPYARASDPAVAYDAKHGVWLINSLGLTGGQNNILGAAAVVNRSTDGGATWGNPVTVHAAVGGENLDKNWIVCDDTAASPFYGRCYVEFDDNGSGNSLRMDYSTDGGLTWTPSSVPPASVIGGQPLVQPNGTVVMAIDSGNEGSVESFVSTDGGVTYTGPYPVAGIASHTDAGSLRSGPLPSAEVDGAGKVYAVWQDCRFRAGCAANDIVMSTSTDGVSWSPVVRIPIGTVGDTQDHFLPGIAVDRSTSGTGAHLSLLYYFYPQTNCTRFTCQLDVGFVASRNGGTTWSATTQLAGPMSLNWLPNTNQGRMVGDYMSTSYANSLAHGLFEVATLPTGTFSRDCVTATPNCHQALTTNATGLSAPAGEARSSGDGVVVAPGSVPPPEPGPVTAR